ncbi:MAG: hypothetical protein IJM62_03165 [Lachnospiraceae bacterium]|nr:hypothetical protein [Lachnospiraceae bacterium]
MATAIRTFMVLVMAWLIVLIRENRKALRWKPVEFMNNILYSIIDRI